MMNHSSLAPLWAACVDRLKDRINNRSVWEALEKTAPVGVEGDLLIIGMETENFNQATHIQQHSLQPVIQQTITEIFQKALQITLIEGLTAADWEARKAHDAKIAAIRQAAASRPVQTAAPTVAMQRSGSWDSLYESLSHLYSSIPFRTLPQGRARFANEALYLLVETMETLYPDNNADESVERALGRILDRVSGLSEIPAVVIAFELERLRAWRKSEQEA